MNVQNKKCFDVDGGKDAEAQNVHAWPKHNGANQRWTILYLEDKDEARTSGMGDFGFKINEPFYIVSRMPFKRVVELTGSNLVIKRIDFNRNRKQ